MFKTITDRFFVLDDNCDYVKKLREHEASIKLYAELVDEFCAEQKIEKLSHSFRCDDRLIIKVTEQERKRLIEEYGARPIRPGTLLGRLWTDFLKRKKAKGKFAGDPYLLRYMPWSITNFQSNGYEHDGHVYVTVDGDGIESAVFPDWCREITGEEFYRCLRHPAQTVEEYRNT